MPDSLETIAPAEDIVVATGSDTLHAAPATEQRIRTAEPDTLTGSQTDVEVAQSHYVPWHLQELLLPSDSACTAQFEQLLHPDVRALVGHYETQPWRSSGMAGDPVDYQFRNDDYVTSIILLSFFMMAWVIASSWRFLRRQFKDFFYTRERPNLFAEREDNVLRGRVFLIVQTCFLIALLFFTISRTYLPEVFNSVSPYILLGSATVVSIVYYVGKILLYNIINHTFFSPAKCKLWNDTYLTSVFITGCGLLPIVLLVVFFDVPFTYTALACILLLSVIKMSLLYKCHGIFFNSLLGGVHIFLYLCTLEIIPLGFFAFTLVYVSNRLLSI